MIGDRETCKVNNIYIFLQPLGNALIRLTVFTCSYRANIYPRKDAIELLAFTDAVWVLLEYSILFLNI